MKRILSLVILLFLGVATVYAQTAKTEKPEFRPHWSLQLQGGVAHTIGEADFCKLLSGSLAVSGAYQFTPIWGLRVGVSGWEGKGAWLTPSLVYQFNFLQVNADVTVDLANLFAGFKHTRTVNPYVFLGVGSNFAFNNGEAAAVNDSGHKLSLLWRENKVFCAGRAGVGVNFRVCDRLLLGLEVNTNMMPDRFNSKQANNVDWQMNALVGITYRFGKNYRYKQALAPVQQFVTVVEQPAPVVEAPVVEAPVVEVAPVVEAPAPVVEQPAPVVEVVETPAPVVETPAPAKSTAPLPPSPDTYKIRQDVFFLLNGFEVQSTEDAKLDALAASLNANPGSKVSVVGYADARTGKSTWNYWLSGWRAKRVSEGLQKRGISPKRIRLDFKGDREQPYSDVEDNRVVICIVR